MTIANNLPTQAHLECGCYHSLGGYNSSSHGHDQREDQPALWSTIEERVREGIWVFAYVCSLAAICEQEARIGVAQPTELDRVTAESTNVGEEGFYSSERKKYAT